MSAINDITNSSILSSTANAAKKTASTTASSTTSTTSSDSASSSSSTSSSKNVMGKQDFLTLLVAQLKNQDPLNPDDPTQFTAQLAQFSSLEQLYNLNDSMNNMVTSTNNSADLSALSMIGKQVTYSGSSFSYSGDPVQLGYTSDGSAAQVQLLIQDSTGKTVQTLNGKDLTSGNHLLTWDGLDQNGNSVPSGTYTVVVQATGADGTAVASSPIITSEVTGVDLSGSTGAVLNTKAGNININKLLGVSSSGSSATSILNQTTSTTNASSSATTAAAESALASSAAQGASNSASSALTTK